MLHVLETDQMPYYSLIKFVSYKLTQLKLLHILSYCLLNHFVSTYAAKSQFLRKQ